MAGSPVEVSVVIPCRNAAETIGTQLAALGRQRWAGSWEVVVSDNGSTDATREVIERFRTGLPQLRVVDSSDRPGPAHARNVGAAAAAGASLLFCDADDEVADDWLAEMGEALRRHDFVAARLERGKLNPDWVRHSPTRDGLLDTAPPFLPYAFSAALGIKRELHLAVGGFDETFVDTCEDRDYCYRVQLSGIELMLVPGAVVHYRLRQTFRGIYENGRGYAAGNVHLYARYRSLSFRRPSQLKALVGWLLLWPRLLLALRGRRQLARWCWRVGWRIGRLQGSLRYRVLAL